ncbi:hypothetical protein ACFY30_00665 [Streptomyces sp. NPDC000345]|uniref:hypothetical protein n=1 Tax=Streptomyces sp. NPDC000345 TaxID=3364537 RepID=UPI0036B59E0C
MSTPPPPQNPYGPPVPPGPHDGPQNPYGQQPAQPPQGPYAAGPYGQPGPQPPQPYGPPPGQQPYGAPYPPPPYGWAPPPRKSRTGLILGIVGGVVGLAVLGVVGLVLIGVSVENGFPDAEYRLNLPKTLLDGRYELTQDLSDTEGQEIENAMDGAWDAKVTDSAVGEYGRGGDDTQGALLVSGMYGRFQDTDDNRDEMLKGVGEADGLTVVGTPKDFRPDGSDTTVTCEVVTQTEAGTTLTYPVCAWADGNTAAVVAEITEENIAQDASDIDLEAAAETTLKVRSETRAPL